MQCIYNDMYTHTCTYLLIIVSKYPKQTVFLGYIILHIFYTFNFWYLLCRCIRTFRSMCAMPIIIIIIAQ